MVSAASGGGLPLDAGAPLLDNLQDCAAALSKAAEAFGAVRRREAVGKILKRPAFTPIVGASSPCAPNGEHYGL
jgi:hypothetical protein